MPMLCSQLVSAKNKLLQELKEYIQSRGHVEVYYKYLEF